MAGVVRVFFCFFAFVLLSPNGIHGKPFFPGLWCDMICIEYDDGLDDSVSTTTSQDSLWDPCSSCPVSTTRPRTTTPNPQGFMPWSLIFPSSMVGMNITSLNGGGPPGGGYIIQPWNGGGVIPFPGIPGPIPAAATAVPSAVTAAPGATTAAPSDTTAAPTTAAAG